MYTTRSGRYGENLAVWINWTINSMSAPERESYKCSLIAELKTYSLKPRKEAHQMKDAKKSWMQSNNARLITLLIWPN